MNLLASFPKLKTSANQATYWPEAPSAAKSIALADLARSKQPILVITQDISSAYQLEEELKFFLANDSLTEQVSVFPDWETLPYDNFSPHQDIVSDRLALLYKMHQWQQGVVIIAISTLMHRLVPASFLHQHALMVQIGDEINVDKFRLQLEKAGYRCVSQVMEHGEFAVRGSIIDIFPMGSNQPFRLDMWDEEVETIRTFDTANQRTLEKIEKVQVLPAHEFSLDESGIAHFRKEWRARFDTKLTKDSLYTQVSEGIAVAGLEYYLPLFFDKLSDLFDYIPEDTLIVQAQNLSQYTDKFVNDVATRYESRNIDRQRPLLTPNQLFLDSSQIFEQLKRFQRIEYKADISIPVSSIPDIKIDIDHKNPLDKFRIFQQSVSDHRLLIVAETAGRRESIIDLFKRHHMPLKSYPSWQDFVEAPPSIGICEGDIRFGYIDSKQKVVLIAESELFGLRVNKKVRRKHKTFDPDNYIRSLVELTEGDPIVHISHGVGRFMGLQTISTGGSTAEYLTIHYAGDDKLYVPVDSLHLVSRYSGTDKEHAPINKLGSEAWAKAKKKAAEKIRDVAAELLEVYAKREAKKGTKIKSPEDEYKSFCDGFPFEETPDQKTAIEAVKNDLGNSRPMDRLVCGDVGFGKTEVAMRAAFIAVQAGKQVCVLVPTTLLAQQHFDNFQDRFANWPVKVELMSRFRSGKNQTEVVKQIASGQVDIVVGTHKLLQDSVVYKDLGLVIIDEEHRFGVNQKEKLKRLRTSVDILTLTATPIPRTLNMSMSGMRDLSIIATPPEKRLAVKTFVREHDKGLLKEAITREIMRGGQVFVLHNSVETIERRVEELQSIVPEANIEIGHGQMREKQLEKVMQDFYHQRFNVLVCTTIIETGIDIPSANTIIIDRADKFGLAQLHQLRGRVGRSHHQAFAYLMIPSRKTITKDAVRRLEAIEQAEHLGSGFTLATHDLEIRGAGEILGDEQSGQMQAIGFTLFQEMLERAVTAMRDGKEFTMESMDFTGVEMDLRIPALIPDDYLPDVSERLNLYKRIANAKNDTELDQLKIEMIDRFGLLPDQVKSLFTVASLKIECNQLGIAKLDLGDKGGKIEFVEKPNVEPIKVIQLIQSASHIYKMVGSSLIKIDKQFSSHDKKLQFVKDILAKFR
jgi:transcription-repair coupling factor (superfamily II helicase)